MNLATQTAGPDNATRIDRAFKGQALYGDDFSLEEIQQWFESEREGYFNLYGKPEADQPSDASVYAYESLAQLHGWRWLNGRQFTHALGVGSADGAELLPILKYANEVTVLEPSDGFATTSVAGKPVRYVKPDASGVMPFQDAAFDLAICFSVLHHIPNVSTIIRELFRVLQPGGCVLLREPTHSMGDWRRPRRGLTKHERGIPVALFRDIVRNAGFEVVKETRCNFSLTSRLSPLFKRSVWTYDSVVKLDAWLCSLPIWTDAYHATSALQRFRPTGVAFVLRKPPSAL
jgi:SAM-dependent methyltransferase